MPPPRCPAWPRSIFGLFFSQCPGACRGGIHRLHSTIHEHICTVQKDCAAHSIDDAESMYGTCIILSGPASSSVSLGIASACTKTQHSNSTKEVLPEEVEVVDLVDLFLEDKAGEKSHTLLHCEVIECTVEH